MIDPNEPAYPLVSDAGPVMKGITIKLELAARFMSAFIARPNSNVEGVEDVVKCSLLLADELIKNYNEQ